MSFMLLFIIVLITAARTKLFAIVTHENLRFYELQKHLRVMLTNLSHSWVKNMH